MKKTKTYSIALLFFLISSMFMVLLVSPSRALNVQDSRVVQPANRLVEFEWECQWRSYIDLQITDICTDSEGNIYVGGVTWSGSWGDRRPIMLKYDTLGNLIYDKVWGLSNRDEIIYDIAIDSNDNVYFSGLCGNNPLLIKLDDAGNEIWSYTYSGSHSLLNLALDSNGDIYGFIDNNLVKIANNGTLMFSTYIGMGIHGLLIDSNDFLYILGNYITENKVAKYSNTGIQIKNVTYGIGYRSDSQFCIDANDNIYVSTENSNSLDHYLVTDQAIFKFNTQLDMIWEYPFRDFDNVQEYENYHIEATNDNNIMISGPRYPLLKLSSKGDLLWNITSGDLFQDIDPDQFCLDSQGNSFLLAEYVDESTYYDEEYFKLVKISNSDYSTPPISSPFNAKKTYVVLIAIENYPGSGYDLLYPEQDAADMIDYFRETCNIPTSTIYPLINNYATTTLIFSVLDYIQSIITHEDELILYYSGHGDVGSRLFPYDMTYLTVQELQASLDPIDCGSITVLIDACRSGGFTEMRTTSPLSVITSCMGDQDSYEYTDLKNGAFTYFFIEAGQAGESLEIQYRNLKTQIMEYTFYDQVPWMYDSNNDLDHYLFNSVSAQTLTQNGPTLSFEFNLDGAGHISDISLQINEGDSSFDLSDMTTSQTGFSGYSGSVELGFFDIASRVEVQYTVQGYQSLVIAEEVKIGFQFTSISYILIIVGIIGCISSAVIIKKTSVNREATTSVFKVYKTNEGCCLESEISQTTSLSEEGSHRICLKCGYANPTHQSSCIYCGDTFS